MKKTIIALVIVVVALAAVWLLTSLLPGTPSKESPAAKISAPDTSAKIQQDLDKINTTDLDAEFKEIDADLNQL